MIVSLMFNMLAVAIGVVVVVVFVAHSAHRRTFVCFYLFLPVKEKIGSFKVSLLEPRRACARPSCRASGSRLQLFEYCLSIFIIMAHKQG